jgi:hypothetical protein
MPLKPTVIFLAVAILFLTLLLIRFSNSDASFYDNMVPELIGFCLEGIFFIGLFTLWEQRKAATHRKDLSQTLRGFLGVFLKELNSGIICADYHPIEDVESLNATCKGIDRLLANIKDCNIEESSIASLQKLSDNNFSSLENLLPVAAELSAAHLISWHQILEQVNELGRNQDRDQSDDIIVRLLEAIKEFDRQVV